MIRVFCITFVIIICPNIHFVTIRNDYYNSFALKEYLVPILIKALISYNTSIVIGSIVLSTIKLMWS